MMLAKRTEYALAGVLAVYIVFFTRPALGAVATILSNPIAQIAALAGVIFVGAKVSLMLALLLAIAVVLSTPAREHMTTKEKDEMDAKTKKEGEDKAAKPKSTPKVMAAAKKSAVKDEGKKATAPAKPTPSEEEPAPAADKVAKPTTGGTKEGFSLLDAAPF